jgi:hypothetical protein
MAQKQIDEIHRLLENRYYDITNPASYKSINVLLKDINNIQREANRPAVSRSTVQEWLEGEEPYSTLKQSRVKFSRNRYALPDNIGHHLQCDLLDVRQFSDSNDGITMLLACVDLRSRYIFMEPLMSKEAGNVLDAFKSVVSKLHEKGYYKIKHLQVDSGKEWYNKPFKAYVKSLNINMFTAGKPVFAERLIRSFYNVLYKVQTRNNSRRFIHILQQLVDNLNKSYHRGIKTTPYNVFMGIEQPKDGYKLSIPSKRFLEREIQRDHASLIPINSLVRVGWNPVEGSNLFTKGYHGKWSEELFRVRKYNLKPHKKVLYYLSDLTGEKIEGSFYREELNKVSERFLLQPLKIDKVLKRRKLKSKPYQESLVTYKIYPKNFYSWIRSSDIEDLQK